MLMKRHGTGLLLAAVITALGAAAGVLRYFELTKGLEHGLAGGSPLIPAMRAAAIAGALLAAGVSLAIKPTAGSYAALYRRQLPKTASVAAGFLFAASAAAGLVTYGAGNVLRLVLSLFAVFCGATMVFSVASDGSGSRIDADRSGNSIFAVFPVFFFGFLLVALYVFHSNDAVLENYGYVVAAGVVETAAAYYVSGLAFGDRRPRRTLAVSCAALFLSVCVALGEAMSGGDMQVAVILAASAVWNFAAIAALTGPSCEESEKPSGGETEQPSEETGEAQ